MSKEERSSASRDPEDRRSNNRARAEGPVSRALRRGRSGYGSESVRPHLRDALELKKLLTPTFPPREGGGDRPNGGSSDTEHD